MDGRQRGLIRDDIGSISTLNLTLGSLVSTGVIFGLTLVGNQISDGFESSGWITVQTAIPGRRDNIEYS